jgi:hypothetical protein
MKKQHIEKERDKARELSRMIDLAAKIGKLQAEAEAGTRTSEEDIIYLDEV